MSDNSTRLVVRCWHLKSTLIKTVCLLRVRVRCWLWGIQLGRGALFHGMPLLFRSAESTIVIGENCTFLSIPRSNFAGIDRPCSLVAMQPGAQLRLGNGCGLSGTAISCAVSVTLGDHVICGANCTITDSDFHHTDPARRRDHNNVPAAAVVIEDNVWLGMRCVVLKGVCIGRNTVVAAGSIVTRDLPPDVLAAGVPARVVRPLLQNEDPAEANAAMHTSAGPSR